jgi:hypothetical protein
MIKLQYARVFFVVKDNLLMDVEKPQMLWCIVCKT